MGIFITSSTPFLEEMLEKASNMSYPEKKISLFVYNRVNLICPEYPWKEMLLLKY